MDKKSVSSFIESNQKIESFKPVGFDLKVETTDGKVVILENGVTEILVSDSQLQLADGSPLGFEQVMKSVPDIELSFNVAYLEDIYSAAQIDNQDKEELDKLTSRYDKVKKVLSELEEKLKDKDEKLKDKDEKLKEKEQALEESSISHQAIEEQKKKIEEHAELLETQLEKIESAKIQQENMNTAEKLREAHQEQNDQDKALQLKRPSVAEEAASPEDSSSSEEAEMLEQVLETLKATLFVTGALNDESDTGEKGSGYTNLSSPTLEGTTLANLNVNISINGTLYTVKADGDGNWSFTLPSKLASGAYEYEISVKDQDGNAETTSGTITVDTTVPTLDEVSWKNEQKELSTNGSEDASPKNSNIVNDSTPQLSGISSAGAIITLAIGDKTYKTIADEEGKWTLLVTTALPDGVFNYTLTAETKAGNVTSQESSLEVDTGIDDSYFTLDSDYDSGTQNDFITSNTTPKFNGVTEPNCSVVVTINGETYSVKSDDDGNWSITANELPEGTHKITVVISDRAGNEIAQETNIKVDKTAESESAGLAEESDTGFSQTDQYTNATRPNLTGKVEVGSTIVLFFNGKTYTDIEVNEDGTWFFPYPDSEPNLNEQDYTYTVTVSDAAGNTHSYDYTFTVDTTATLTAGLDISSVSDSGPKITNDARPKISGTAEVGSIVKITLNDGETITVPVDDEGKWLFRPVEELDIGSHTYKVTVEDLAGNTKEYDGDFQYAIAGTKPPVGSITFSTDTDSGTVGDLITNTKNPVFTGICTKGVNAKLYLWIEGVKTEYELDLNDEGEFTFELPTGVGLNEGVNVFELELEDPSTGLSTTIDGQFIVDTIAPEFSIQLDTNTGASSDFYTQTRVNIFSGTVEPGSTIKMTINEQEYYATVEKDGSWTLELPESLGDDNYPFDIVITDKAGNESTFSDTLVVANDVEGYLVNLGTEWVSSTKVFTSLTPQITVNPPAGLNDPGATVTVRYGSMTAHGKVGEAIQFTEGVFQPGVVYTGTLYITITDSAGNEEPLTWSNVDLFVNDELSITGGLAQDSDTDALGDGITTVTKPNFAGESTAIYHSNVAISYTGSITINGETHPIQVERIGSENKISWAFTYPDNKPPLATGEHPYTITITDNFGTSTSFDDSIHVVALDVWLDPSTNTGGLEDVITSNTKPIVAGKASVGATVRIKYDGVFYDRPVNEQGFWTFEFPAEVEAGDHYFTLYEQIGDSVTSFESFVTVITEVNSTVELTAASSPNGENISSTALPTFTGVTEPNATVQLIIDGQVLSATADKNGSWSITVRDPLIDKKHDYIINITGTDSGVSGTESGTIEVMADVSFTLTTKSGIPIAQSQRIYTDDAVFNGTGVPGTIIRVTVSGDSLEVEVAEDGTWRLDCGELFFNHDNGSYYSSTYFTSIHPDSGATSQIKVVTYFDRLIPVASAQLAAGSITGSDAELTNKDKPTIQGTTDANAKVTIIYNGEPHTVQANASGGWSFEFPKTLGEGRHDYTVIVTDVNNRDSIPFDGSFVVDTSKPVIDYDFVLDDPYNTADNITSVRDQTFTGKLDDNETLKIYINGVLQAPTFDNLGNWELSLSQLVDGPYEYEIKVTNQAGTEVSTTGNFVVDSTVLDPTVALAVASDSGDKGDKITNQTLPQFTGQAEPGATVELIIEGETYTGIADENGFWLISVTEPLSEKTHIYTVTATDVAGNVSNIVSDSIEVVLTPETSVTITSNILNGTGDDANIVGNAKPTIEGTAPAFAKIQIVIGGVSYDITANENGVWSFPIQSDLNHGVHNFTANVLDTAGNIIGTTGGTIDVDIETSVEIGGIVGADGVIQDSDFTFNTVPSISGTGEKGATITLQINGFTYIDVVDEFGNWTIDISDPLPDDTYTYTVTSTDVLGNTDTTSSVITVDTTLPTQLTGGLSADTEIAGFPNVTDSLNPIFSGTTEPGAKVTITINGRELTAIAASDGGWRVDYEQNLPSDLEDGNHPYSISVEDQAGNVITTQVTGTIEVVASLPPSSSGLLASSDSGTVGDNITNQTQGISIGGETRPGSLVSIIYDGVQHDIYADADGMWNFTFSETFVEGLNQYEVIVTDPYGKTSSTVSDFYVQTTLPNAPTINVDDAVDGVIGTTRPTFSGSTLPLTEAKVTLTINGKDYIFYSDENGDWSRIIDFPIVEDGNYQYSVTVEDNVGNVSLPATGTVELIQLSASLDENSTADTNNTTDLALPTFVGRGIPGSSILFTIDGKSYPATVDADGNWSITLDTPLTEGNEPYTVTLTNGDLTYSTGGSITVDFPPDPPTADIDDRVDSFIGTATPTFSGSTLPLTLAKVTLTIDGEEYTFYSDSSGNWSHQISVALKTEGEHNYSVTVEDADGDVSPPTTGTVELILLSASLDPESTSDNSNTTDLALPTFVGRGIPGFTIELTIGGKPYPATVDDDGNWSITLDAPLTDGNQPYTVLQTNGDLTYSTTGSIDVDLPDPIPDPEPAPDPDTGGGSSGGSGDGSSSPSTLGLMPKISGVVEPNALVVLTIAEQTHYITADKVGNWEHSVLELSEGKHDYTLIVNDMQGEENITSGVINVEPNATPQIIANVEQAEIDAQWETINNEWIEPNGESDETFQENDFSQKQDLIFEGELKDNNTKVELSFNDTNIDIEYAEDLSSWSATIPEGIIQTDNNYTVKITNDAGEITTINDSYHKEAHDLSINHDSSEITQHNEFIEIKFDDNPDDEV